MQHAYNTYDVLLDMNTQQRCVVLRQPFTSNEGYLVLGKMGQTYVIFGNAGHPVISSLKPGTHICLRGKDHKIKNIYHAGEYMIELEDEAQQKFNFTLKYVL